MISEQESEVIVSSINGAKIAVRKIQEKVFEVAITESDRSNNKQEIFKTTLKLNEFLDEIAMKLHKG